MTASTVLRSIAVHLAPKRNTAAHGLQVGSAARPATLLERLRLGRSAFWPHRREDPAFSEEVRHDLNRFL